MEFSPFIDVMGWAVNDYHYDIEVVTCGFTKTVVSAFNVPVIVDRVYDEIEISDFDALAIPGGFEEYGFFEEAYSEKMLELIRAFHAQNKIITSYCPQTGPYVALRLLEMLFPQKDVSIIKTAMGF